MPPVALAIRRLVVRHSLRFELAGLAAVYLVYEAARGLIAGSSLVALQHAHEVARWERSLGVFVEARVQDTAAAVPGLVSVLSFSYLTMHLLGTGAVLLWIYHRSQRAFAWTRTTLLIA